MAVAAVRGVLHRLPVVFALNRRRLRRAAERVEVDGGVIRALPTRDGALVVALSYDDGPSPANTPALLELLERHEAQATFFVVGNEVERHPELARAVVAAGHELGNHSATHANPLALDGQGLAAEFDGAAISIERATGVQPALIRPPYGKRAGELARLHRDRGISVVLWSIDSGDTAGFSPERVASEVIAHVRPGDVVLMHDGGDERPRTLAATELVLLELGRRDYRFVTISDLIGRAYGRSAGAEAPRVGYRDATP